MSALFSRTPAILLRRCCGTFRLPCRRWLLVWCICCSTALTRLYAGHGWLDRHNLQIMFSWPSIVLVYHLIDVSVCIARTGLPSNIKSGEPGRRSGGFCLTSYGWQMFRRVTLPGIRWKLLYGVVLANARAISEFSAVSVVSGSIRGEGCFRCRYRLNC